MHSLRYSECCHSEQPLVMYLCTRVLAEVVTSWSLDLT